MSPELIIIIAVGAPLLTVGAAWGGVKASMNGVKEDVKRILTNQDEMFGIIRTNCTDIARIDAETKANSDRIHTMEKR